MACQVFVGGLPQGLQESDLREYFNNFGDDVVEVEIKMDKVRLHVAKGARTIRV